MTTTLYIDKAFLTELIAVLSAIYSAARQCALKFSLVRGVIATVICTLYPMLSVIIPVADAVKIIGAVCITPILSITAFGNGNFRRHLKASALILASALMLGGVHFILSSIIDARAVDNTAVLIVSAIICTAIISIKHPHKPIGECAQSTTANMWVDNEHVSFTLYHDTGNTLCDPLTGRHVIVISKDILSSIHTPITTFKLPYACAAGEFTMDCFYPSRLEIIYNGTPHVRDDLLIGISTGIKVSALGGNEAFGINNH